MIRSVLWRPQLLDHLFYLFSALFKLNGRCTWYLCDPFNMVFFSSKLFQIQLLYSQYTLLDIQSGRVLGIRSRLFPALIALLQLLSTVCLSCICQFLVLIALKSCSKALSRFMGCCAPEMGPMLGLMPIFKKREVGPGE